jgi:hypothetical protein
MFGKAMPEKGEKKIDTRTGQRMGRKSFFCHSEGPCANKWKKADGVSVL